MSISIVWHPLVLRWLGNPSGLIDRFGVVARPCANCCHCLVRKIHTHQSNVTVATAKKSSTVAGRAPSLLMSMAEVMHALRYSSRQSIYDRLRSDSSFPRPRRIGPHRIGFLRAEVETWVTALPTAHFDGFDAIEQRGGPAREVRVRRR